MVSKYLLLVSQVTNFRLFHVYKLSSTLFISHYLSSFSSFLFFSFSLPLSLCLHSSWSFLIKVISSLTKQNPLINPINLFGAKLEMSQNIQLNISLGNSFYPFFHRLSMHFYAYSFNCKHLIKIIINSIMLTGINFPYLNQSSWCCHLQILRQFLTSPLNQFLDSKMRKYLLMPIPSNFFN